MMNLFIGFEQANRYAINSPEGEVLGYIAEEQRSFISVMSRQILRTHRPFRALILDTEGNPVLWLRRPFSWINSRMYVQRMTDGNEPTSEGEPILETFAEVQQRWHLWRRRYDLFISDGPKPILSHVADRQPEPEPTEELFTQFASIDSPFLAWTFLLRDARQEEIASVDRAFRGFGREVTEKNTGQYIIRFKPTPLLHENGAPSSREPSVIRDLKLEEKAVTLATAVNIDYDYFSRHSEGGHLGFLPFFSGGSE
ncbi:Scramblase [Schizopora paradoxa]|uniref:Phospholipid scramblase n=1 Tax=Schizopora paradoxa TaxID=27342 RepID=A0A0H2RQC2_9AGAM|nr:Scramblase [Schizopora paradoxa]